LGFFVLFYLRPVDEPRALEGVELPLREMLRERPALRRVQRDDARAVEAAFGHPSGLLLLSSSFCV
jgi:hypothetical protein